MYSIQELYFIIDLSHWNVKGRWSQCLYFIKYLSLNQMRTLLSVAKEQHKQSNQVERFYNQSDLYSTKQKRCSDMKKV